MSYTNVELVNKHVIAPPTEPGTAITLSVQPTGSEWSPLTGGVLQTGSVRVNALTRNQPLSETLQFQASQAQSALSPVTKASVTIASDSSLGTLYIENIDYTIDYQSGAISAVAAGAISSGATTHLWYFPLTTYTESVDYEVDYTLGRLRRITSGGIVSGQDLQVTFVPVTQSLDESVYAEAVNEANQLVSATVDPSEDFGADLNLQAAATYLAAGIVCRVAGTFALANNSDRKSASSWLALAESFRNDGASALDRFRPPRKRLSGPQIV
jgi:hypothetical protein